MGLHCKGYTSLFKKVSKPIKLKKKKMRHHKCIHIERCCRFRYILHFSYEKFQFVSHCLFPHSKTGSEITFFMRVPWVIKIFSNRHVVNISRQKVRSLPLSIRYKKAKIFRSLFTSKIFLFGNKQQPSVHERKKIPRTFRCWGANWHERHRQDNKLITRLQAKFWSPTFQSQSPWRTAGGNFKPYLLYHILSSSSFRLLFCLLLKRADVDDKKHSIIIVTTVRNSLFMTLLQLRTIPSPFWLSQPLYVSFSALRYKMHCSMSSFNASSSIYGVRPKITFINCGLINGFVNNLCINEHDSKD